MSKKFTPANQSVPKAADDDDPDVQVRKYSGNQYKTGPIPGQGAVPSAPGYNFTGVTPGKTYVHPPNRLINGRVMYPCKYLGHLRVPEPRGSKMVHDAIDKLLTVADVNKANLDEDLKDVDLSISIRSLVTVDRRSKKAVHQHPLPFISFSADDKRNKKNMFAYISKGKPPTTEHTCYVYQCSNSQASEITATVGQSFELAYKNFLETKQAQQDFKRLKEMLKTASDEEKVDIEHKLVEVNKIRATEVDRQKRMASIQAKMPAPYVKPVTSVNVKLGTKGAGLHTGTGKDSEAKFEDSHMTARQLEEVQKEVKQLEIDSEHQLQAKQMRHQTSSVEAKWENITMALEPFQMEPSLDPDQQYLVKRIQTKELDSAIGDVENQIQELEDAFDWRTRKGQGPVPSLFDEGVGQEAEDRAAEERAAENTARILENITGIVSSAQFDADNMEFPDLPANFVMDEMVKAREKAAMPKEGTVKLAAGAWHDNHHD